MVYFFSYLAQYFLKLTSRLGTFKIGAAFSKLDNVASGATATDSHLP
jgi:hypothetical protein